MVEGIWVDVIGYVGMGFVLLSFLMKKIQWVRIINMIGAALSLTYGILTLTIPTAALNGSLLAINAVFVSLFFIKQAKEKKAAENKPADTSEAPTEK